MRLNVNRGDGWKLFVWEVGETGMFVDVAYTCVDTQLLTSSDYSSTILHQDVAAVLVSDKD